MPWTTYGEGSHQQERKIFSGYTSLHWILAEAFQDTDAEHVVKDSCKNYGESGYHVSRSLNNYYRLDDCIKGVQQRLRIQLSALKCNNEPGGYPSIQEYTNEFKVLVDRLILAKEKGTAGKLNQEYLQNIQATKGSSIMTINTLCVADDTINYKKNCGRAIEDCPTQQLWPRQT